MADRGLLLSHLPTEGRRGFEIGALMSPFLSKADHDVTLVDRLSTEDLRAKFAADSGVAADQIAEVDVVVENGELFEALAWRRGEERRGEERRVSTTLSPVMSSSTFQTS